MRSSRTGTASSPISTAARLSDPERQRYHTAIPSSCRAPRQAAGEASILDGEIAVPDIRGVTHSRCSRMRSADQAARWPIRLRFALSKRRDLRALRCSPARRPLGHERPGTADVLRSFRRHGRALFAKVGELGGEGIVCKPRRCALHLRPILGLGSRSSTPGSAPSRWLATSSPEPASTPFLWPSPGQICASLAGSSSTYPAFSIAMPARRLPS